MEKVSNIADTFIRLAAVAIVAGHRPPFRIYPRTMFNYREKTLHALVRIGRRIGVGSLIPEVIARVSYTIRASDPLTTREMWRRHGRPLERRCISVGGKLTRFLAP